MKFIKIKNLIDNKEFTPAVTELEKELHHNNKTNLLNEYIYLKRLSDVNFNGKDLYLLMKASDKNDLITTNNNEYCDCIDEALINLESLGIESPLTFIRNHVPTMKNLVEARIDDFNNSICLDSRRVEIFLSFNEFFKDNFDHVNVYDTFDELSDKCYEGVIFDKFPDQIQYCRDIFPLEPQNYYGVWINCPKEKYLPIIEKGINIKHIVVFTSALWKWDWFKKEEHVPDFTELSDFNYLDLYDRGDIETKNIELEYTGRSHSIQNTTFYEVNIKVIRHKCFRGGFYEYSENPFITLLKTIYREAENKLRLSHGLPKIGEGWVSEMLLYNLINKYFPNTIHQTGPDWLKPQHLDIYILYKKIAFEYQGRQHFEPVDFFGGIESFEKQKKLDQRKYNKCKNNKVKLIYWRYDEIINEGNLIKKLRKNNIDIPNLLSK